MARATVMVVGDAPAMLQRVDTLLSRHGYRVVPHPGPVGADIVGAVQRGRPDVLIVDLAPATTSPVWELLRQLRQHRDAVQLPVIFCTPDASGVADIIERLQESRCAVVPQPLHPEGLLARVEELTMLTNSRLPRPLVNLQRLRDATDDVRKEKEAWIVDQPTHIKTARC
jgi:DNA-binding response OmpR family regulator